MMTTGSRYETPRTVLFAVAVVIAVTVGRFVPLGSSAAVLALAATGIAVWHGAFDNALAADALSPRLGERWPWIFFPVYLALAAMCMLLWWWLPACMLPIFLLYSAWHFGLESELRRLPGAVVRGVARGLLPIAAACHWWPGAVAPLFAQMMRGEQAWSGQLTAAAGGLLWPCVLLLVASVLWSRGAVRGSALLWVVAELCLFRWCPPLVGFAVYFCFWHTPDHLVSTSLDEGGAFQAGRMWRHLRAGLWPWLVCLAGAGLAGWAGRHVLEAYAGVLFIALSALTVPHMALAELIRAGEQQQTFNAAEKQQVAA